jgi:hypothetical protein
MDIFFFQLNFLYDIKKFQFFWVPKNHLENNYTISTFLLFHLNMIEKNNNYKNSEYNWISIHSFKNTLHQNMASMINPIQLHDYIWHK